MIKKFEEFLNEEKILWDGKQLHLGQGLYGSLPDENSMIIFSNCNDESDNEDEDDEDGMAYIYNDEDGLYGEFQNGDKSFKDENELVKYLNDNGYEYIGYDKRP